MEGNIAATYTLIYRFLKQQSQNKAAEAVKKAAKTSVVLRDDIEHEGPSLEDIIKEWKAKGNTKSRDTDSSSEDSESSKESSSDSEDNSNSGSSSENTSGSESEDDTSDSDGSDDESDDKDKDTPAKKLSQKKAAERDTSVTLSSENSQESVKQVTQIPAKKSTKDIDKGAKDKKKGSESDSSHSDSSDSDSSSKSSASDSSDAESTSSGSDSSSSSDSSDEDEAHAKHKAPKNEKKTTKAKSPSTSESSSESDDESDSKSQSEEDAHVAKKRKTSEKGAAVTIAVASGSQPTARTSQRKEKPSPRVKERFQRIKVQGIPPELLLNNGYEARGGATNDYGKRAHHDLIVTRGAGFRKEKNKKKRGSYRGGEITMENHSIKFDF